MRGSRLDCVNLGTASPMLAARQIPRKSLLLSYLHSVLHYVSFLNVLLCLIRVATPLGNSLITYLHVSRNGKPASAPAGSGLDPNDPACSLDLQRASASGPGNCDFTTKLCVARRAIAAEHEHPRRTDISGISGAHEV